jgi:hypothetical protein
LERAREQEQRGVVERVEDGSRACVGRRAEARDARPRERVNAVDEEVRRSFGQSYERRGERTYWYEAPRFAYAAALEVTRAGFAWRYPGLWDADPDRGP